MSDEHDTLGRALDALGADECLELLATLSIGRVAWAGNDQPPVVVPVNYAVDEGDIVFRSDPGSKLEAIRGREVAFQVDFVDPFHRTGWSVLVHGVARELAADGGDAVHVDQWTPGAKAHWVRITATVVTGRRIRLPEVELDPRGYR